MFTKNRMNGNSRTINFNFPQKKTSLFVNNNILLVQNDIIEKETRYKPYGAQYLKNLYSNYKFDTP